MQYLQKQLQRRDAQIQVLLAALDGCELEKELSESVACAFAWDLSNEIDVTRASADSLYSDPAYNACVSAADDLEESAIERWEEALEAARAARTATEIALEGAGK